LWRVLHRAVHIEPDSRHARRQAGGVRCIQLGDDLRCAIFGDPRRPACCSGLQPSAPMCGDSREYALAWLTQLEIATQPDLSLNGRTWAGTTPNLLEDFA
jgi:hypothetical protein